MRKIGKQTKFRYDHTLDKRMCVFLNTYSTRTPINRRTDSVCGFVYICTQRPFCAPSRRESDSSPSGNRHQESDDEVTIQVNQMCFLFLRAQQLFRVGQWEKGPKKLLAQTDCYTSNASFLHQEQ